MIGQLEADGVDVNVDTLKGVRGAQYPPPVLHKNKLPVAEEVQAPPVTEEDLLHIQDAAKKIMGIAEVGLHHLGKYTQQIYCNVDTKVNAHE